MSNDPGFFISGFDMPIHIPTESNPVALKIHGLLHKIDRLQLPTSAHRDIESIPVLQVSKEIDHALPWQGGTVDARLCSHS